MSDDLDALYERFVSGLAGFLADQSGRNFEDARAFVLERVTEKTFAARCVAAFEADPGRDTESVLSTEGKAIAKEIYSDFLQLGGEHG